MPCADDPVEYFDRYTGRVETEAVYGEQWLRWAYQTRAGRAGLALAGSRAWFSALYGWLMRRPSSRGRIRPFVERYGLDPAEFADPIDSFDSFDAFFTRRLRPGCRPVDPDPGSVVFPADGRHLGWSEARGAEPLRIKGDEADLERLLGSAELAGRFAGGALVLSRLCPVDYHRFHFPAAGTPGPARPLPGPLYSVNPIALRRMRGILPGNRRMRTPLEAGPLGSVAIVEIGATNVGSIVQTFAPGRPVERGDEKGYFRFGGSAMATLFEPGRVRLADDLVTQTAAGRELYAHAGDRMGLVEPA